MKTNKTTTVAATPNGITAILTEDNKLVITVPINPQPFKLTKNGKNFVVAESGSWPQNWVTVDVGGDQVGLTLCALIKNPDHPDNQPKPVTVATAPTFFKKGTAGKPGSNGHRRITPSTVA